MKNSPLKRTVCLILFVILVSCYVFPMSALAEEAELSDQQRNAIAMVNYITVLTQEINASKNSRLYMEQAYSSLINNTYPNAVDSRTQSQLTGLLDVMENYRMIDVKRERLQFVYEQNQAQAIRAAVPNPLALLSGIQSYRPSKIAASLLYMTVDSVTSYMTYTKESDLASIKDGWALDDEEAQELHRSRKGTFTYMLSMARENNLPGDMLLTEESVQEFVKWKNDDNVIARILFFENNRKTYQYYGGYWLTLAESYYEHGDYQKCIDAMSEYDSLGVRIFLKDYEYARVLPLAIAAAEETCSVAEYEELASKYAQLIMDNTSNDDWALRYYVAQTYIDLNAKTGNRDYLRTAYDIVLLNVNSLAGEQRRMNTAYLEPVQEIAKPKDADKTTKKQIDEYNKMLKNTRKTELAPVYEPMRLNCDLLFALADELKISETEKETIEGIIHKNNDPMFLVKPLDELYDFSELKETAGPEIEFGGTVIIIPAEYVSENTSIVVTITENGADSSTTILDWKVDEVEREEEGNVSTFHAVYVSTDAKKYDWQPEANVRVEIVPLDFEQGKKAVYHDDNSYAYSYQYETKGTKSEWYDYLKVWEGHKNNWYDYAKVWENSVVFEQVDS